MNADYKNNNKNTPLVSVIVPIYKVEKYLKACIDSILVQSYKNYEVILVDDGSPDHSGEICDDYKEQFDCIKVIHQNNQGVSAARNNGVVASKGDFITFIDPDDIVTKDYIEYLMSLILKYHAQISVGGSIYQYEGKDIKTPKAETMNAFYEPSEALSRMNYVIGFGTVAWAKMYKRSLVEANPYPIGKRYEDIATTYKIIGDSTGVAFGNKQIYIWFQRPNSFMHNAFDERQLDGIEASRKQLEYVEKRFPLAVPAAKYRYTAKAVELAALLFATDGNKQQFEKLRSYMNEYSADVLKDKNVKHSIKMRIRAMKLGYYPAKLFFFIHEGVKQKIL